MSTAHRLMLALLVATTTPVRGDVAVQRLDLDTPRTFGYTIGDRIEHVVTLELHPAFELDERTLPERGRITRWLTLHESAIENSARRDGVRHVVRLRYQVVNAADRVIGTGTPPHSLRVLGPDGSFPVVIPAWGFTIGPIIAPQERAEGGPPMLQPAAPPPPVPIAAHAARVAGLAGVAVALLAMLAWRHLGPGRWRANRGHFARACRRLEARFGEVDPLGAYRGALADLHTAFNATAGRAVFEHDLARFFAEHPVFEPLRASIEALYAESRRVFYAERFEPPGRAGLELLRDLGRACREVERGA